MVSKSIEYSTLIFITAAIISTLCGKHVCDDLGPNCEKILRSGIMRKFAVFSSLYIMTKNIQTSFFGVIIYSIVVFALNRLS